MNLYLWFRHIHGLNLALVKYVSNKKITLVINLSFLTLYISRFFYRFADQSLTREKYFIMSSSELLLPTTSVRCKIGETGLIITDQAWLSSQKSEPSIACTYYSSPDPILGAIPFKDILWCEHQTESIYEVSYVTFKPTKVHNIILDIQESAAQMVFKTSQGLVDLILSKAYKNSIIKPSILILLNPHGGKGKAKHIFHKEIAPVLEASAAKITVIETKYSKHAMEIAEDLDIEKYDIIACCSGDGIPHEVINGLYHRPDKGVSAFNKLAITQLPAGSGNALTLSTHGTADAATATFNMLKSVKTKMDLMALTQLDKNGDEKISLSFLSQCYGTIADCDIGTEHLRWMGPIRFDLGVLQKTVFRAKYPCSLYVKYLTTTKEELLSHFNDHVKDSTLSNQVTERSLDLKYPDITSEPPLDWILVDSDLTDNLSIFYVGKMPMVSADTQFFPAALPNDGSMDMILTDSRTSIMKTAAALLSVDKGTHVDDSAVRHHKVAAYRLVPKLPEGSNHYISIDGESFPFKAFQVEVLPSILTTLTPNGNYVETSFSK